MYQGTDIVAEFCGKHSSHVEIQRGFSVVAMIVLAKPSQQDITVQHSMEIRTNTTASSGPLARSWTDKSEEVVQVIAVRS